MRQERSAIVTGAARRVGRAIADALIADGWSVIAHVHHQADAVSAGATKVVADLEDPACADVIFAAGEALPPVRLLVNNAGKFAWDGFGEFDAGQFGAHMAVNVRAPALLIERFAGGQSPGQDSQVVNILDAKLAAPQPDFLSYTLSKQALAGLTELAARALGRRGVRVNAIAPALMLQSPGQSRENFEKMHGHNLLGRGVSPDDVIGALRYLVGATCVTGQTIVIDGGQRFLALERDVQFLRDE
jgi:NAD(P)-dependent dehydrogenase (short-subunit alcohol dehydrogenase family)